MLFWGFLTRFPGLVARLCISNTHVLKLLFRPTNLISETYRSGPSIRSGRFSVHELCTEAVSSQGPGKTNVHFYLALALCAFGAQ